MEFLALLLICVYFLHQQLSSNIFLSNTLSVKCGEAKSPPAPCGRTAFEESKLLILPIVGLS